jgi:Na+:H+ antiporter, NhaA family
MTDSGPESSYVRDLTVVRTVQRYLKTEASGGVVLLIAAIAALVWVNLTPWQSAYFDLWHQHLSFDFILFHVDESLGHFVNDGLMAIFFFVVGLEIKRELLHGELNSPRRAALPVMAAIGGMVFPALIYAAFNFGGDGARGWGIPVATDIAFAVGVLALLGSRVPFGLKVFLLALAIADDLGGIVVIAVFYTESISVEALFWAGAAIAAILIMQRAGVRSVNVYVVVGALLWVAVLESGIHATIAGVILALLTPAKALHPPAFFKERAARLIERFGAADETHDHEAKQAYLVQLAKLSEETEAPLDRLEHKLHLWVRYLIVPVFALANAGLVINGEFVSAALESPVAAGIFFGLPFGKLIGIVLFSWIVVRLKLAALPAGATWPQLAGVAMIGGVGFTVSLFIAGLAFTDPALQNEAKAGVLAASVVAGVVGYVYLLMVGTKEKVPAPAAKAEPVKATH